jgi:hypothetical protein
MANVLRNLYRKHIPQGMRKIIYDVLLWKPFVFKEYIKRKFIYIFHRLFPDTIPNNLYSFMGKYGITPYPYPFILEYKNFSVECIWDEQVKMYFIMHENKRLYYPEGFKKKYIIACYKTLILEQDDRNPHQYIRNRERLRGKNILDIGASEGIFTLCHIDIINHSYLFECDERWFKALNLTFAPWNDKVTIVSKYISNRHDENNTTIDLFLEDKEKKNLFLKMDIEGYEQEALKGAKKTFQEEKDIDYSICVYHKENDAKEINDFLLSCGLKSEYTDGYLYMVRGFRKGIIRRVD